MNGNKIGGEFRANAYTAYDQINPKIAGLLNGNFVVVWDSLHTHEGVFGQMFDINGNKIGTEFQVNTSENISQLDYIKQYHIDDNKIHVYSENIDETTPLIVKDLVKTDANILEIKRVVHSLEDIYLKLMNNQEKGV